MDTLILDDSVSRRPTEQLAVRWVPSEADVPEWLWSECFAPTLEGRWWYAALERAGLDDQFEFLYGIVEDRGQPVGIVPVFLMDVPLDLVAPPLLARLLQGAGRLLARVRYQRTLFVGSPCAEEGKVGLVAGVSLGRVATAVQDALEALAKQRRAALIVWKDFPATDWSALQEALVERREAFPLVSYPGTRLAFAGRQFDEYLEQLERRHRQKLKRRLRHSAAMGKLLVEVVQHPGPALLEQIFDLFWQCYEKGETKFERLNLEFFRQVAQSDHAYFILLRDPARDERLVAFGLCFLLGRRAVDKFIGLDHAYDGDWYLYFRLWQASVEWALGVGAREIQSGQTVYRPKLDLGLSLVPLMNVCKHRNRIFNRLLAALARRITWATLDEDLAAEIKAHGELPGSSLAALSALNPPANEESHPALRAGGDYRGVRRP